MINDVIGFVGPSVRPSDLQTARRKIRLLPPVRRGDLDTLVDEHDAPERLSVGIVDGEFMQSLAVSPKEILRAMDRGVRVLGAASMGALRAAECAPYGMIGVGQIYALFRDATVDRDDEVAVSYDPESGRPLSMPLINIRASLAAAVEDGALTTPTALDLLQAASDTYFPQRTVPAIIDRLCRTTGRRDGHQLIESWQPAAVRADLKRADARLLIDRLLRLAEDAERCADE